MHPSADQLRFIVISFVLLVFIEAAFFRDGNIIFVILGGWLAYYGFRHRNKWILWTGLFFLGIAILSLWSLRLLILAVLAYIFISLWKGVPAEEITRPLRDARKETPNGILKNRLFSVQSTPFSSYEWEDVHIQGIFGDIHVDVTETVLPKGTSFISIRQGIGKVKIDVPYEIPVRVHYTSLLGDSRLFGRHQNRIFNEQLHMQDGYGTEERPAAELIITVSSWLGDLEVSRK
ncbi:Predicted membrane protein [Bhargavaea ginsengi]|uniref:Predicted membrane protein n=1 Tax=Bhargavaea ginsengi TaxID=426757 RepID=A0A1H6UY54_9BACL|nr:cell wall-active antibiotics response protein LiaF [Bhargavaea ginsengi]SEI97333.1 Predicted membrane protein [Bhargavaea ginsengi]